MFAVIEEFTKYFKFDAIDLDNWVWKLYSKASVALCMVAAALCICTTYFGKPIDCYAVEDPFVTQYCWVHGSYHFAIEQRKLVDHIHERIGRNCLPPEYYDEKLSNDDPQSRPTTEYYQWVIFMLFLHGTIFMIPDKLWKFLEGGLVSDFVPFDKASKTDLKEKAKQFYRLPKSQNSVYFASFLGCETLNFFVGVVNFCIMDWFLKGKFATYGTDAINYFMDSESKFNPMCSVFPTLVSCEYYTGAVVTNALDTKNHICMLSQNIINEKIYLILWFWILILFGASMLMLLYRIGTIVVPSVRERELFYRARKGNSNNIKKLRHLTLPQWFILSQIGRNSKSRDFNKFLYELEDNFINSDKRSHKRESNNETVELLECNTLPSKEPLSSNGDAKAQFNV